MRQKLTRYRIISDLNANKELSVIAREKMTNRWDWKSGQTAMTLMEDDLWGALRELLEAINTMISGQFSTVEQMER